MNIDIKSRISDNQTFINESLTVFDGKKFGTDMLPSWSSNYPYPVKDLKDDDDLSNSDDSSNSSHAQPKGERWPPLGAPNDDEETDHLSCNEYKWCSNREREVSDIDKGRLAELESEQEQLNNSLLALTSHFAQVQFRLKQIVDASPTERENLLVELEEFANRGIPDLRLGSQSSSLEFGDSEKRLDIGHERQKELICQLKRQLEDLENYAYETGEAGLPQSVVLEKQNVIIEQLKAKLNLNVDDLDKVPIDELKLQVDSAVKELINPLRMKEQLVNQLQTQIVDLERFIEFLQDSCPSEFPFVDLGSDCKCNGHTEGQNRGGCSKKSHAAPKRMNSFRKKWEHQQQMNKETECLMDRVSSLLNMITFSQFGCTPKDQRKFHRNVQKKNSSMCHWGDIRAVLEVSIASLCEIAEASILEEATSDSVASAKEEVVISDELVSSFVRKKFCPALRDLIHHGLIQVSQNLSLVPFLGCFPAKTTNTEGPRHMLHAWDLILKYYQLKKGDQYNQTPARRLSQSFNLEMSGGSALTNKQQLLQIIGNIVESHVPLKRSLDAHFKAFVSAALNKKKLITWLRLIFRTPSIVERCYEPWSYVSKTGFEDAFKSLDRLNSFHFDLSIDLAVKPFQNIKDVFN